MDIRYQDLVAAVERAINEADPIGLLAGGAPSDRYAPEIGTIIPLLANAHRPDDVTGVLHGEFLRWFGEGTAGPRQAYEAPARQIWRCFTRISEERLTRALGQAAVRMRSSCRSQLAIWFQLAMFWPTKPSFDASSGREFLEEGGYDGSIE